MIIFEKNGHLFCSGGFYQSSLSDTNKFSPLQRIKYVNESILAVTHGQVPPIYDLQTKNKKSKIRNTYCFMQSKELIDATATFDQDTKKRGVASLGLYIIECLSAIKFSGGGGFDENIENCIICYAISPERYGYILIKDGTIHPTDGDITQNKEFIKDAVINLIRQHNKNPNVERRINAVIATEELSDLQNVFVSKDSTVSFIPLGYDSETNSFLANSEDLFWSKKALKLFNNVKFQKIMTTKKKAAIGSTISLLSLGVLIGGYVVYQNKLQSEQIQVVEAPKLTNLMLADNLISKCFQNSADIFGANYKAAQFNWAIDSVKCDKNGLTVVFKTDDTISASTIGINDLKHLFNNPKFQLSFNKNKKYQLNENISIDNNYKPLLRQESEIYTLNNMYNELGIDVKIDEAKKSFVIVSNISPIYLLKNNWINKLALKQIEGRDDGNGGYSWVITGSI